MLIRPYRPGEELALHALFHASVHQLAMEHYSPEQLQAWAPLEFDADLWCERIRRNQPWVAEDGEGLLGFADLQDTGHIDQLFVAAHAARRGVGSALLRLLIKLGRERGMRQLTADVSLTAERLFLRHGFELLERQHPLRDGVMLANARMWRAI